MTTRKDGNKNQIVTNNNYDQNSLSIFWNNQTKMASDKIYTQKIIRYFFERKYGSFRHLDLLTGRLEMSKRGKVYYNIAFFKKMN